MHVWLEAWIYYNLHWQSLSLAFTPKECKSKYVICLRRFRTLSTCEFIYYTFLWFGFLFSCKKCQSNYQKFVICQIYCFELFGFCCRLILTLSVFFNAQTSCFDVVDGDWRCPKLITPFCGATFGYASKYNWDRICVTTVWPFSYL